VREVAKAICSQMGCRSAHGNGEAGRSRPASHLSRLNLIAGDETPVAP
jgi:hypothetical protein